MLPRLLRGIVDELLDLGGGRRQAQQIKVGTADQRVLIRQRRRRKLLGLQLSQDECIDGILHPISLLQSRPIGYAGPHWLLKRPLYFLLSVLVLGSEAL